VHFPKSFGGFVGKLFLSSCACHENFLKSKQANEQKVEFVEVFKVVFMRFMYVQQQQQQ